MVDEMSPAIVWPHCAPMTCFPPQEEKCPGTISKRSLGISPSSALRQREHVVRLLRHFKDRQQIQGSRKIPAGSAGLAPFFAPELWRVARASNGGWGAGIAAPRREGFAQLLYLWARLPVPQRSPSLYSSLGLRFAGGCTPSKAGARGASLS